ncbi:MAG: hypothetical protein IVW53_15365 [Chloroflexi bacterium]|nr:hypothetical protein [Chloroflexota bacterium]
MALQFTWKHPDRHEVELALCVHVRMMHIRGWQHLVVAQQWRGATWVAVEMAPHAREDDARDWSQLLPARYRVETTIEALIGEPWNFSELYIDAGIGPLLSRVEWEQYKRRETWVDIHDGPPKGWQQDIDHERRQQH